MSSRTILAIGAHLDDAFIGVGGALVQAAKAGDRVVIVTLVGDFSTRPQTRGQEAETIAELMAISGRYGFEHRLLGQGYHQVNGADRELKAELGAIVDELQPDVGFIHEHTDHWTDHREGHELAHDAMIFPHGLSSNRNARYTPLIYAYSATPLQTYGFRPDTFFDVGDVIVEYMDLIRAVDACGWRQTPEEMVVGRLELADVGHDIGLAGREAPTLTIKLSAHGWLKLGDCIRDGDLGGCRFGIGVRTVWSTGAAQPFAGAETGR
jgi:LmbE family N-acetylglucosaminyl deacetylase